MSSAQLFHNGPGDVERGILGNTTPRFALKNLARHVSINLSRDTGGEDAGKLPVGLTLGRKLTINMATARAIGIYPGWKVRTEADLINEDRQRDAEVSTIEGVVQDAVAVNLHLAVAERNVVAGEQRIYESRSRLLPRVDIGAADGVFSEA